MGATEQDPFAIFHTPPPNETPGERIARIEKEAEEKRISDLIDDQLKADRLALKKQKYVVRVLLLGQSESGKGSFHRLIGGMCMYLFYFPSGKSTTLKSTSTFLVLLSFSVSYLLFQTFA